MDSPCVELLNWAKLEKLKLQNPKNASLTKIFDLSHSISPMPLKKE